MTDQMWMKFISTGSIRDYLSYKNCSNTEEYDKSTASYMASDSEEMGRSVKGYGADHSVNGYGAICNSDRRI